MEEKEEAPHPEEDPSRPITHIIVAGFHHQFGPKVEYVYPPFKEEQLEGAIGIVPKVWEQIPFLSLPDGVHQAEEDLTFFTLPSLPEDNRQDQVYGISCFRQIHIRNVHDKSEYTRSQVQKAVCVISRMPFYGAIHARLSLVTRAYFDQGDFKNTELLPKIYESLNTSFSTKLDEFNLYIGLPLGDFVRMFKRDMLVFFKLLMLEKKVVAYGLPVSSVCLYLLSMISLYPGSLAQSLSDEIFKETPLVTYQLKSDVTQPTSKTRKGSGPQQIIQNLRASRETTPTTTTATTTTQNTTTTTTTKSEEHETESETEKEREGETIQRRAKARTLSMSRVQRRAAFGFPLRIFDDPHRKSYMNEVNKEKAKEGKENEKEENESEKVEDKKTTPSAVVKKKPEDMNLFYPYIGLRQMDELTGKKGYFIGTSNMLFTRGQTVVDVVVYPASGGVEFRNSNLARTVSLTAADKRFIDNIIEKVEQYKSFTDGSTHWEGSDDWVRAQFCLYLEAFLQLMSGIQKKEDTWDLSALVDFNCAWVKTWMQTTNYKYWRENVDNLMLAEFPVPQHPGGPTVDFLNELTTSMTDLSGRLTTRVSELETPLKEGLDSVKNSLISGWKWLGAGTSPNSK